MEKKKKLISEMSEKEKQKYYEKLEWKIRLSIYIFGILFLLLVFNMK
jgi:hypothetical protein